MAASNGPTSMDPTDFAWSYGTVAPITGQTGTAGNALSAMGGTYDASAQSALNSNIRVLADKVNAIIVVLQNAGLLS